MNTLLHVVVLSLALAHSAAFALDCVDRMRAGVARVASGASTEDAIAHACARAEAAAAREPSFTLASDDGRVSTDLACAHVVGGAGVTGLGMVCYDWRDGDVYGVAGLQVFSSGAAIGGGVIRVEHAPNAAITGAYACVGINASVGYGARAMLCTLYGSDFTQQLSFGGFEAGLGLALGASPGLFLGKL